MPPKKRTPRKRTRKKKRRRSKLGHFPWGKLLISSLVLLAAYVAYLDFQVYRKFEGNRWSLPARVYARPLELYAGQSLSAAQFASELRALGYRFVSSPSRAGEVSRQGGYFQLISRPFDFWDGRETSLPLRVSFSDSAIERLQNDRSGDDIAIARLDPLAIGSIHAARQEDRILLQLDEVPKILVAALIAVEDRSFYDHMGVSPRSVARAFWVNIQSGRVVQGGSTLTQQLAKNFLLSNQRSFVRKANEAIMALLIEWRYDKGEILEAYLNEVYLAQDGQRAIHGFGLGSRFLFQRPLDELTTAQLALLVGMVKGPSYYNPRRHPERARERRNLVLGVMHEQGIISRAQLQQSRQESLGLLKPASGTSKHFPAFLDLVRRQLRRDYAENDLISDGLRIFTTLDPQVQWALQKSLDQRSRPLLEQYPDLQGAGLVTHSANAEVLALVGGRQAGYAGFNRALDARRQVGSLIKPAVYLTALEQPDVFSLASLLDDEPLEYEDHGQLWAPNNYDRRSHGEVMLYTALAHSYNIATARLGFKLGVNRVVATLRRLGVDAPLTPYPSLFLGATDLSPLEVTQLYISFASAGFQIPLRSIRAVLDANGEALQRYDLNIERIIDPAPAFLINQALQKVVSEGTARGLNQRFSPALGLAGKTGTTNGLRDSWYAGYDGEKLAVIWMGRDSNEPMGLTGSSGAMQVWADLYATAGVIPQQALKPENVVWHTLERSSGKLADTDCDDTVQLPFIESGVLPLAADCSTKDVGPGWLPGWLR
ncbi:Multimodular transpeptidase-transglycosylase [hydrothermal vent metagenome]|uniref:Penicillin-binding protein 1B n=1 Tax=hydrothermal vent metagenome TaxID=652676 RepID=A0A3B0Y6M0_9ZZZZ